MIHHEIQGRVAVITLDRPERRNALDHEHCDELTRLVTTTTARVILLTGAGPHFCSGADLSGVEDTVFVTALHRALDALATVPVPTMAFVQGAALGAGTQLAMACDLRVALPDARFGVPAARLGLMVDHWTIARLTALVGQSVASAMLMVGEEYNGEAANRIGFVHRLGDRGAAEAWAQEIAGLAPLTMAGHKLGLQGGGAEYDAAFRAAWASADLQEGKRARTEKRPPDFEGR